MSIVDPSTLTIGMYVTFNSRNPYDATLWSGEIISLSEYEAVKHLGDLVTDYAKIKKMYKDMKPIDELTYIVLKYFQEGMSNLKVFALDWLDPSSIKIINNNNYFYLKIFDHDTTYAQTVINLLAANGIKSMLDTSVG